VSTRTRENSGLIPRPARKCMPGSVTPMLVSATQRPLSGRGKKPWPSIPPPAIRSKVPCRSCHPHSREMDSGSVIHRDHSLDAASQHHLGSDPQRSSFSRTGCEKEIVNRTHHIKDDLRRASLTDLRPKRKPLLFPASCVRALSAGFMTLAMRVHRAMPGVDAPPVLNQRE
jgi:hypothetical protein